MGSSPISGLAYVVVQTKDVDGWRAYATDVVGMMPSRLPLPDGSYGFRMDERIARIIIQPGDDDVAAVGWDLPSRADWNDLMERLEKAGIDGQRLSRDEAMQRGAMDVYRVTDPSGGVVEFVYQALIEEIENFVSPLGVRFVTEDQSMGHVTRACRTTNRPSTSTSTCSAWICARPSRRRSTHRSPARARDITSSP